MTPVQPPGHGRAGLNLSEWALHHRPMVLFLIVVAAVMGTLAYGRLGQSEDPPFTFKVMVIRTDWPGASAREVEAQVTDRIERKLQELPLEYVRSYSRPGESLVFIAARDATPSREMPELWYQARKKIGDIRGSLPAGVRGPFFNDEFGDTYANIYAITGEGAAYRDLKDYGDRLRAELLRVPGVAKVDFIGEQEERIYVEFSNAKLATLGLDASQLVATLAAQNAVAPAGVFETPTDRIHLRPSGAFGSVEAIRALSLRANNRTFRLGDVAEVSHGYVDPPQQTMRWRGHGALGVGVTMVKGGDVIELGRALDATVARMRAELPVGVDVDAVASMPRTVRGAIEVFVRSLAEAVLIVLVVSLASLGLRTGLVVAVSIPLVLATTFLFMDLAGIGLHKISLGALVLSLGLLVDDAIIAVEMMAVKLEQGYDRFRAASAAWTSTAFPMLTGTLITVAGFLPIATAKSSTGEYTRSLFEVSAIALVVSWFVAVIAIPYLGYRLLPDATRARAAPPWRRLLARLRGLPPPPPVAPAAHDADHVYQTAFYRRLRVLVDWTVAHRAFVIAVTLAAFAASLAAFRFVPQQFFPASARPELLVDLRLPEGSSYAATLREAQRMEGVLAQEPGVTSFVAYVGTGSPRFYLPLDQQLAQSNLAQFVLVTRDNAERERVRARLIALFDTDFPAVRGRVSRLENGPPVGFPVQFRVSGDDLARVRAVAAEVRAEMERDGALANVQFDWDEPSKVVRLVVDQDKARVLGLSSQDVAQFLNTSTSGVVVTQYRDGHRAIDVVLRGHAAERAQLSFLRDLAIPTRSGKAVPITQVARLDYGLEDGVVWRRNRQPTVTVRADLRGDAQGPDVTHRLWPRLAPLRASLPVGDRIEIGGAVEDSARGQRSIAAGVPLLVLAVLTLLMLQLRSFSRTVMVLLTAPLGLIGVVAGLLAFRMPFGFVAMLGSIALSGIIMRNSVILVDQIEQDIAAGATRRDAIVGATVRRFRPIVLTAAAAVLAMVPLARSDFFGPMAVAMMGGIVAATVLTLGFLPALYATWFRVGPAPGGAPAGP